MVSLYALDGSTLRANEVPQGEIAPHTSKFGTWHIVTLPPCTYLKNVRTPELVSQLRFHELQLVQQDAQVHLPNLPRVLYSPTISSLAPCRHTNHHGRKQYTYVLEKFLRHSKSE